MIEIFSNRATSTLAGALPASGTGSTTLTLASGTGALYPQPVVGTSFFRMTITDAPTQLLYEVVLVTARVGDVCTIVRAQEGTAAQAWNAGDVAGHFDTAGTQATFAQVQQAQLASYSFAAGTGTGDALIATLSPAPPAIPVGFSLNVLMPATNATSAPTLNVNGFGAAQILSSRAQLMPAGSMQAGVIYNFSFNGSFWICTALPSNEMFMLDTSTTPNIITLTGFGINGYAAGQVVYVRVANANTGGVVLNWNGIGNRNVVSRTGAAFNNGVLKPGGYYRFLYDGATFIADVENAPASVIGEVRMWVGTASAAAVAAAWGFGWHLANGTAGTQNLTDRFLIGAGNSFGTGAAGGASSFALSVAQLPSHSHGVADPGHAHAVFDPGHAHGVGDPGHAHGVSQSPHAHGVADPGHAHSLPNLGSVQAGGDNGGAQSPVATGYSSGRGQNPTNPSGTGIGIQAANANIGINGSGTGIFIGASGTGIGIYAAGTGISIAATGSGAPISLLPPFYALAFVQYTGA